MMLTREVLFAFRLGQGAKPPPTPTAADRIRRYQAKAPQPRFNSYPWPHLRRPHNE